MSAFLGPIHHWLYGTIGKQEELTRRLAEHARASYQLRKAVMDGMLEGAGLAVRMTDAAHYRIARA